MNIPTRIGGLRNTVWLLFVARFVAYSYGFSFYDMDKRQDLVPFPRVGRTLWSYDDKRQGLVPFPRVGKRQELIPFPRIGRSWDDMDEYEDWDDVSYVLIPYKRNLFTPRIGRRKRSTNPSDDGNNAGDDAELAKTLQQNPWELVGWVESVGRNDDGGLSYDRNMRQLIPHPRVGRGDVQLRAAFVPRLGRKRSEEEKRPAFTPRIGRAMFTPRIGRSDPQFTVSGRAFTPRIGRAQFTPRIGRSSEKTAEMTKTEST